MGKEYEKDAVRSLGEEPQMSEDGKRLEGYGIVFGSRSEVMLDWASDEKFVEVIAPGAITDEWLRSQDIMLLGMHDDMQVIARSNKGKGSLRLTVDERGVRYSTDIPDTTIGRNIAEMVKRGDMGGSSFGFYTNRRNCEWSRDGKGMLVRTINRFDVIREISIVARPAYQKTSVSVRDWEPVVDEVKRDEPVKSAEELRSEFKRSLRWG